MTSIKIKLKQASDISKKGRIIYRINLRGLSKTIMSSVEIFPNEWNDRSSAIIKANCSPDRKEELEQAEENIQWDIRSIYQIISRLVMESGTFTADDIVRLFEIQNPNISFIAFMRERIKRLENHGKYGTAATYSTTLNSFMRFLRVHDVSLNRLDSSLIKSYEEHLRSTGLTKNTTSFYMRVLRSVYNQAVENGLVEQARPFCNVYTGIAETKKRAVSAKDIRKIIAIDLAQYPALDFARDVFMFSFYTRGMAFIDIAYLRRENLKDGYLIYKRRKTGCELRIKWEDCMKSIVKKYQAQCNHYLLPIIKGEEDNRKQYQNFSHWINKQLKRLSSLLDIKPALTMYVARHSWASIAKNNNIPITVISEGMGHSSIKTTQIYLASLNDSIIDGANKRIIKIVKGAE